MGWGLAGSLALTLWSASKGIKTLMEALNVAYGEREERGFFRRNALALALTLAAIAVAALAIAAVVFLPAVLGLLGLQSALGGLLAYARWPILAAAAAFGLAVMYRYGPSRSRPSWALVTWGAIVATGLWLAGSALFSLYVSTFGSYNRLYRRCSSAPSSARSSSGKRAASGRCIERRASACRCSRGPRAS